MTPERYQSLAVHARSIVLRDAWLAFLKDLTEALNRR